MTYKRIHGGAGLPLVECINPKYQKWLVRWDYQPYTTDDGDDGGITFVEHLFLHKPSIDEVKSVILDWVDAQTDEQIMTGFVWEGKPVQLNFENEFNYKAAYDLAVQTDGANLPVKFKLGKDDSGAPVYHTFRSLSSLQDFYVQAMAYIQQCLQDGWTRKDSIDWSPYEELL